MVIPAYPAFFKYHPVRAQNALDRILVKKPFICQRSGMFTIVYRLDYWIHAGPSVVLKKYDYYFYGLPYIFVPPKRYFIAPLSHSDCGRFV